MSRALTIDDLLTVINAVRDLSAGIPIERVTKNWPPVSADLAASGGITLAENIHRLLSAGGSADPGYSDWPMLDADPFPFVGEPRPSARQLEDRERDALTSEIVEIMRGAKGEGADPTLAVERAFPGLPDSFTWDAYAVLLGDEEEDYLAKRRRRK